jgi:hypothetical protein
MDPDDIQLISFFNAKGISEEDGEMSADIGEEQIRHLSLHERYCNWLDIIDR